MGTIQNIIAPLAWSSSEAGPDVGIHLSRVRAISDVLLIADSAQGADACDPGTICALMAILRNELDLAETILANGPGESSQ